VPHGDDLRLALGVGFLGAFTTFSTFELETSALLDDGAWSMAAVNVCASLLVGLLALRAGLWLAKAWFTG
jgi:CrcB protein